MKHPPSPGDSDVILLDPMLATGGSAVEAVRRLREAGATIAALRLSGRRARGGGGLEAAYPELPFSPRRWTAASTSRDTSCPAWAMPATGCSAPGCEIPRDFRASGLAMVRPAAPNSARRMNHRPLISLLLLASHAAHRRAGLRACVWGMRRSTAVCGKSPRCTSMHASAIPGLIRPAGPRWPSAWPNHGCAMEKPTEALELLNQSFAASHPEAPFWKGQALATLGRINEALELLVPLLAKPGFPLADRDRADHQEPPTGARQTGRSARHAPIPHGGGSRSRRKRIEAR